MNFWFGAELENAFSVGESKHCLLNVPFCLGHQLSTDFFFFFYQCFHCVLVP